jgi:hypothetical protein
MIIGAGMTCFEDAGRGHKPRNTSNSF